MSYQVRDCYILLIFAGPKILPYSNTDKVMDKDLLPATVAPVVMVVASLSPRPLAPPLAPTLSMFHPYPRPAGIAGPKLQLVDQRLDFESQIMAMVQHRRH